MSKSPEPTSPQGGVQSVSCPLSRCQPVSAGMSSDDREGRLSAVFEFARIQPVIRTPASSATDHVVSRLVLRKQNIQPRNPGRKTRPNSVCHGVADANEKRPQSDDSGLFCIEGKPVAKQIPETGCSVETLSQLLVADFAAHAAQNNSSALRTASRAAGFVQFGARTNNHETHLSGI